MMPVSAASPEERHGGNEPQREEIECAFAFESGVEAGQSLAKATLHGIPQDVAAE